MTKNKVYIETYGCQMNLNDTEIVASILNKSGYIITDDAVTADIIFLNTCSVRDNAEHKIRERLKHLRKNKKDNKELVVGILGCMAERLREKLIEEQEIVDLVVGPDEYRKVPQLIEKAYKGEKGIAVKLSRVETYDDIEPLRTDGLSAWVSIMRGCDKFCTYCVVPFTRGRERSRKASSIIDEIINLRNKGFKEVTLLGQNVNSYLDESSATDFPALLIAVAKSVPDMRIRYTTSHPYDMSDKLIEAMAEYDNICNYIHLPVQSGSDRILKLMNRDYTIEHYLERIAKIKKMLPRVSLSTDIISGFPTETEEEHKMTMDLMRKVKYDGAFMFKYSPRENTKAWSMTDNIDDKTKTRRLNEIIELQHQISRKLNEDESGRVYQILVEGKSKKNKEEWQGRTDTNKVVIFPHSSDVKRGDFIKVKILRSTSATLFGELI
jgi:tRNA-2-methylthio-N6-dimethylallyladenosine synthase